jgi:hypothetical protein
VRGSGDLGWGGGGEGRTHLLASASTPVSSEMPIGNPLPSERSDDQKEGLGAESTVVPSSES